MCPGWSSSWCSGPPTTTPWCSALRRPESASHGSSPTRTPRGTALDVCAVVTDALASRPRDQRRDPAVRTLRQGLGYCWSVAVAADPRRGLPAFTALADTADPDVAWIVRENRRKNRLARLL